jgi:hypothetical protein
MTTDCNREACFSLFNYISRVSSRTKILICRQIQQKKTKEREREREERNREMRERERERERERQKRAVVPEQLLLFRGYLGQKIESIEEMQQFHAPLKRTFSG